MKVEVRFKKTFQTRPYETEAIELCVWEELFLNDGFDRKATTEKTMQSHMEKVLDFQAQIYQMMAEKASDLVTERLQYPDPRDVA